MKIKNKLLFTLFFTFVMLSAMLTFTLTANADDTPVLRIAGTLVEDGQYYIDGFTYTEKPEERTDNYAYFKDGVLWLYSFNLDKQSSGSMLYVENMDIVIMVKKTSDLAIRY